VIREGGDIKLITELSHLQAGEWGVVSLVDNGDDLLTELGIIKGDEVEVVDAEPFEGPLEVRMGDETSSVKRAVAARIYVEVLNGEAALVKAHPHGPHH
jgi:Fe2+ transport system protein FeoA